MSEFNGNCLENGRLNKIYISIFGGFEFILYIIFIEMGVMFEFG